jgi:hypothetical protein
VREGGWRKLAEALRAGVDAYIAAFTGERDENGRPTGSLGISFNGPDHGWMAFKTPDTGL